LEAGPATLVFSQRALASTTILVLPNMGIWSSLAMRHQGPEITRERDIYLNIIKEVIHTESCIPALLAAPKNLL
jgi:hypothetical protein